MDLVWALNHSTLNRSRYQSSGCLSHWDCARTRWMQGFTARPVKVTRPEASTRRNTVSLGCCILQNVHEVELILFGKPALSFSPPSDFSAGSFLKKLPVAAKTCNRLSKSDEWEAHWMDGRGMRTGQLAGKWYEVMQRTRQRRFSWQF